MRTLLSIVSLAVTAAVCPAEETLRVYFLGNSLTMSTTLDRVHAMAEDAGIDLQFGSQLSGGKSLHRHLNYKEEPGQKWGSWETNIPSGDTFEPDHNHYTKDDDIRFGLWDEALAEHPWDRVVFQTYGSHLAEDIEAISAFIDLCRRSGTCENFSIYATWPTRPKSRGDGDAVNIGNIDYADYWVQDFPDDINDDSWQTKKLTSTRDYAHTLVRLLNEKFADLANPILLIPASEVLYVLDQKIKEGTLPGIRELAARSPEHVPGLDEDTTWSDGVNVLYADAVHLNPIPHRNDTLGIFVSGTTVLTGLTGRSPVGLSPEPYGLDPVKDSDLVRAIQETIWEVYTSNPLTGAK